ncbi:MAG: hypothetical protein AABY93_02445 [Bacteroidota bacterium]
MQAETNLCKCQSRKEVNDKNSHLSFLSVLLIALIPKCPFCMLAYSAAITVCSTKSITHNTGWTSFISIALAIITLIIVLYNYKGRRTLSAAFIILLGIIFISYAELYSGNVTLYYIGSGALLIGIWTNGSLLFFINLVKSKFSKQSGRVVYHG